MGSSCGCQQQHTDGSNIFEGLRIRKIYFKEYLKIFNENKSNWIKTFEIERKKGILFNIKNFKILEYLLNSNTFSEHQSEFFSYKINIFLSKIPDALIFFTALSFFTKLENLNKKRKDSFSEKITLNDLINDNVKDEYDLIKEDLMKMCFKKYDHDAVTKMFIELVSEFTLDFIFSGEESIEKAEKRKRFDNENREKLFFWLKKMTNETFYSYIFDVKNVRNVNRDLERFYNNPNDVELNDNLKTEKSSNDKKIKGISKSLNIVSRIK